jgi:hypothetical protein
VLPQTTDEKILHAEMGKLQTWLDGWVSELEKRGRIRYVNLDGAAGMSGATPVAMVGRDLSAKDLIAEGLRGRGRRGQ